LITRSFFQNLKINIFFKKPLSAKLNIGAPNFITKRLVDENVTEQNKDIESLVDEDVTEQNKVIECLVDEDVTKQNKVIGNSLSYIAQSRAMYKIIYVHPPDANFDKSENFNISDNFAMVLIRSPIQIQSSNMPLQKILTWHQHLHFGHELMNTNIKQYLQYTQTGLIQQT
jgi:hypothetical protein